MLIGPGKHAAPGDAVDLLLECHARIRHFLALARRLGEARGESPTALSDTAAQVHRYFTLALPLHAQDEEEVILPAVRRLLDVPTREGIVREMRGRRPGAGVVNR